MVIKECSNCGTQVAGDIKFFTECGGKMEPSQVFKNERSIVENSSVNNFKLMRHLSGELLHGKILKFLLGIKFVFSIFIEFIECFTC